MDIDAAFAPEVTPDDFFTEHFADLLEPFVGDLDKVSDVEVILGVRFDDDEDLEYTITLSAEDGVDVEEGEGFDPPLITLVGLAEYWDAMKGSLAALARTLDALAEKGKGQSLDAQYRMTGARLEALMRMPGHFKLLLENVPGASDDVPLTVLLGDFYDEGDSGVTARLDFSDFEQLTLGKVSPRRLYASGKFKVSGDLKYPMTLAGTYMAS